MPLGRRSWSRSSAAVAAALVLGGGIGAAIVEAVGNGGGESDGVASTAAAASRPAVLRSPPGLTASEIYARDSAGVVDITVDTTSGGGGFGFGQEDVHGEGSGFVLDKNGDIVTNAHVVDGAS